MAAWYSAVLCQRHLLMSPTNRPLTDRFYAHTTATRLACLSGIRIVLSRPTADSGRTVRSTAQPVSARRIDSLRLAAAFVVARKHRMISNDFRRPLLVRIVTRTLDDLQLPVR
jgi:hypothetical protein